MENNRAENSLRNQFLFAPMLGIQQTTNWWYFSYFSQKIVFDNACNLSPFVIICMNCQNLFSGKKKKKKKKENISICRLLKNLPTVLSVKGNKWQPVLTTSIRLLRSQCSIFFNPPIPTAADGIVCLFFWVFFFLEKMRIGISCESSHEMPILIFRER